MLYADLASNTFTGHVPATWSNWSQVGTTSPCLALLLAINATNSLGVHEITQHRCTQVKILNLDNNQLSGPVPYMPELLVLNVSSNQFTEPEFDVVPTSLQLLYLANNNLTGKMLQVGSHPDSTLKLLDVSSNNLTGPLLEDMPRNLSILNISNNAFVGSLPSSWYRLQNMTELRLDNNELTGRLPQAWSAWGRTTGNSLQLSITNSSLHGRVPTQWVEQFCIAIVKSGNARVLFEPIEILLQQSIAYTTTFGPLIELPAQHASINVTLASNTYAFDYNNPASVCGIAYAVRNTALVWGIFGALLLVTIMCICFWQRRKRQPETLAGWLRHLLVSTILRHDKVRFCRQVANRVWFLVSDVGWTIYSQVTDSITIHQVVASTQLVYAYILLAILLLPFAFMFIMVVRISIRRCQEKFGRRMLMHWAAAPLIGLLLAPMLFLGLEVMLVFHGIGVPLPAWWGSLVIDLGTFYRTQSIAEAFLSALPQSIVQSKLYLMGNDPSGVHVYIDTPLFLISISASLCSVFKTIALVAVELHQYGCSLLAYVLTSIKFEPFPGLPWTPI